MKNIEDVFEDNQKEIVMHGSSLAYSLRSGAKHARKGRKVRTAVSLGSAGYSAYKLARLLEDDLIEERTDDEELYDIPVENGE